jgi:hypothetical protein
MCSLRFSSRRSLEVYAFDLTDDHQIANTTTSALAQTKTIARMNEPEF